MTAELAVVLPFANVVSTLAEALRSVLDDAGRETEVLAIDDGSSDGSAEVARAVAAADARVRVVASRRRGLVGALETGFAESAAPFVARMDGDDVSLPGRFALQLARLRGDASLAVVGGLVEADGAEAGLRRYVDWMNGLRTPDEHARDVFVEAPLCHPSVTMRRSSIDAIGGYREGDFAEDWDLWLRLVLSGARLAKVDQPVLRWRHRPGRATFSDARYSPERHRALRALHLAPILVAKKAEGRALVTWGAGPTGRRLARAIEVHGVRFERFVDIDPKKIGRTTRGAPIVGMDALVSTDFVVVAVGSREARELVRAELVRRGRVERVDFVCAA